MIFVDTGAWYALATPSDIDHERAKTFLASSTQPLVTSDYVVDELLTLFVVRKQKSKGIEWRREVLDKDAAVIIRITDDDFANAVRIYEEFEDKEWSFTDCTSYAVMQRLNITQAFAFDSDFHQFGTVTVNPPLE
jgi:predicted nucleic acid-binding protein